MKYLAFLILITSPLAFSDWDDTYTCKTTLIWEVESNGENNQEIKTDRTFEFSLNDENKTLVFGNEAPFGDVSLKVTYRIFSKDGQESFDLEGSRSTAAYHNGTFTYSYASTWGARVVTADCHKM